MLLKDLVVYQTPLLGGQEMTIISLLLRVAVDRPSRNVGLRFYWLVAYPQSLQ